MKWDDLLSEDRLGSEIKIPYDQEQYGMSECHLTTAVSDGNSRFD